MSIKQAEVQDVKNVIDALIQTATTYDIEALDRIYHDDLKVIMIDTDNNVDYADKESFTATFQHKKDNGDPPMNTWAKYHNISVEGHAAHALLSRKNNLNGQDMQLKLSMDLAYEDERWQVVREVIFLHPEI